MKRHLIPLAFAVAALTACGDSSSPPDAAKAPAAPAAPAAGAPAAGAARTLTAEQRQKMLDVLKEDTGTEKKIWLQVNRDDPEAAAYAKAIEDVFRESGWTVGTRGAEGLTFKAGIYFLVGDEQWPPYAETANKALDAAGIQLNAAAGYRAYYEQQTSEKPNWRGPKLAPDQTYVVLIGRAPTG